tara:strand:+ start:31283 stop:31888 length:606 start_codon:yes stop_codon:yes gene_type:complete
MATYPKTGSILEDTISTALSTQIIIYVNDQPVGAIQQFGETQTRQLRRITEIGTDGVIEIVPQSATQISLDLQRVAFDGLSISEAFSRGYVNIQSQRLPFDIVVVDQFSGVGTESIITTYHNCFFQRIGKTYRTDDYIIIQTATVECEYVGSQRGGKAVANSQGTGGGRQMPFDKDKVEQAADRGKRRGSLDFPGLISAAY